MFATCKISLQHSSFHFNTDKPTRFFFSFCVPLTNSMLTLFINQTSNKFLSLIPIFV